MKTETDHPNTGRKREKKQRKRTLRKTRKRSTPLARSRNFLKFLIYLCPTRVNFSTASSTTFPHQVKGAALLLGRSPPSFPFSVFPFRPGNPGLFGALLQPPAPEKKKNSKKNLQFLTKHLRLESGVVLARSYFPKFSIMDSKNGAKECIV